MKLVFIIISGLFQQLGSCMTLPGLTGGTLHKAIIGSVFLTFHTSSIQHCTRLCLYSSACASVNWMSTTKECQLNSQDEDAGFLEDSPSNIYLPIKRLQLQTSPCNDRPCTTGHMCVPVIKSTSHRCVDLGHYLHPSSTSERTTQSSGATPATPEQLLAGAKEEQSATSDQAISTTEDITAISHRTAATTELTTTPGQATATTEGVTATSDQLTATKELSGASGQATSTTVGVTATSDQFTATKKLSATSGEATSTTELTTTPGEATHITEDLTPTSDQATATTDDLKATSDQATATRENLTATPDQATEELISTSGQATAFTVELTATSGQATFTTEDLAATSDQTTATMERVTATSDQATLTTEDLMVTSDQTATIVTTAPILTATCDRDSDCNLYPDTTCSGGLCICTIGYDLDLVRGVCRSLQECSNFGQDFTVYRSKFIHQNNIDSIKPSTQSECSQVCLTATYTCKNFDMIQGGCYTQDVSWFEVSESQRRSTSYYDADHYQRKCDW